MKFMCSLITVEDINRSRAFYEKLLQQKVKYDFGENILFESGFAIHLKSHFSNLIDNRAMIMGGNNFELYFEHDDVDAFVEKLKNNKVELLHEAREQPWRQKVVRFYDPDKNIIEVGESLEFLSFRLSEEGKSAEEIAEMMTMTDQFVKESICQIKKARRDLTENRGE
ncbi:VOC family protein [Sporolactobacillus putidus]|uniref:Glyoxalase/bleomycin resistance/dioxygenase family protein n=1 Tax=Sporolactobacillus putidus TaxID=492735 RepID=A0A917SAS2_9BACL|nr:VOC family protein [Sporolactobacillus putidus]GGL64997.1 glyoxalase/bleomycin resistance/dioxygenase family protein [Sporolactobacillus putidus]